MKRIVRWGVFAVLAVVFVIVAAALEFVNQGKPNYDGQALVPGLQAEVTVTRDAWGVPHIFAKNELDAYRAMGYVHAQDRLFQMTMARLMVQGRLSEVAGDAPYHMARMPISSTVELDRFNRTIGFHRVARNMVKIMPPEMLMQVNAYVEGINTYLRNTREFSPDLVLLEKVKGYKPEPWTAADVLAMGRYVGWFLSANWDDELTRLQAIKALGVEKGWELMPRHKTDGPFIVPEQENQFAPYPQMHKIIQPNYVTPDLDLNALPEDMFNALLDLHEETVASSLPFTWPFASNNWAVAPSLSASGKAILANDPHLSHMLPSIFYQAHIQVDDGNEATKDLDAIGVTFPGMPFIVLGHNRHVAWAATTTRTDNQDLFIEKQNPDNPDQYWNPIIQDWSEYGTNPETIHVFRGKSGGKAEYKKIEFTVRTTRHGPVLNDTLSGLSKDAPPIALSWAGLIPGVGHIAFLNLAHAASAQEMFTILGYMDIPVQNWVFADDQGHIGFFAAGLYPNRPAGANGAPSVCDGTLPANGATTACDWLSVTDPLELSEKTFNPQKDFIKLVPPQYLPRMYDPAQGYIITANNQVVDESKIPYVVAFNYMPFRAARIEELLKSKPGLTAGDMRRFQMDVHMIQARLMTPVILKAYDQACAKDPAYKRNPALADAAAALRSWDFNAATTSVAATVFHRTYREAMILTLSDELPHAMMRRALSDDAIISGFDNAILSGEYSFFDNVRTSGKQETRDEILAAALAQAVAASTKTLGPDVRSWTWGRVHQVEFAHPLSAAGFPVSLIFKRYMIPAPGSQGTVFCEHTYFADDNFPVRSGPAFRQVIDMADIKNASMILDTGQSGHVRGSHFFDQNPLWLSGKTIPMPMDAVALKKTARHTLVLKPVPGAAAKPQVQDPYQLPGH